MIKHIVMWRLHEFADGHSKAENARKLKEYLLSLKESIPQIQRIEVGINITTNDPNAADVVLYSEFENRETLVAYQKHPEHQRVVQFLNKVRTEKRVVDYEAL